MPTGKVSPGKNIKFELNPDDIVAYDYLATMLQYQHRLEEAIAVQTQLVDKLPYHWAFHVNRAELYRLPENYSEAISEVELLRMEIVRSIRK